MGDRPPTSTKEFGEIQELITKKIAEHFAEEENLVFPLLTVDSPDQQMTQAIAELCQEHSQLLAEANRLGNQLHRRDIAHCTGELWTALLDFFTAFEKHAAKEDQLYKFYT